MKAETISYKAKFSKEVDDNGTETSERSKHFLAVVKL